MKTHMGRNPFDKQKEKFGNPSLDGIHLDEPSRKNPPYAFLLNLSTRSIVVALKAALFIRAVRTVVQRRPENELED